MKIENINQWLSLSANIGVLIGIVFLAFELNQANRIAINDSRAFALEYAAELNALVIENSEIADLMIKMRSLDELTPTEEERAHWLAIQFIQIWGGVLQSSLESGLTSETAIKSYTLAAIDTIQRYPGLAKHIRDHVQIYDMQLGRNGPVMDAVLNELGY